MSNTGVIAMERSANRKIGDVSCTYTAQQSCPDSCSFKNNGCYAESSFVGMHTRRLNKAALTAEQLAINEAEAIGKLSGKRPLRLHVVGDCQTNESARTVSQAAHLYSAKHSQHVWGYTHAYRTVDRASWSGSSNMVSILASCESHLHVLDAFSRNYAAAIVVSEHTTTKAVVREGVKYIPCPEQTGRTENCTTCKLCWDDKKLLANKSVIVFAAHSTGVSKVKEALKVINI